MKDKTIMNDGTNSRHSSIPTVRVAEMPWVFTQNHPLDTSSFISEAKRRGFELADGIMEVHSTINGLTCDDLIRALAVERARGKEQPD